METHERLVNQFIDAYFKTKPNSTGLNKVQGEMIKEAIKKVASNQKIDPAVKKRIKTRGFSLNDQDELLCNNLPVVFMENYFEKINDIHSDMGHPGVTKTNDQIHLQYSCIPRAVIEYHIKTCSICNLRKRQVHSLKAIK